MKLKIILPIIPLSLILCLSLFLHLFKINQNPPSLFSDEADANYQAFIFNQCHSDYFGNKFPIDFHSFSDWRTPIYIYSIAFIQKIIGHVDLAARFPSAIYGTLIVLVFYLIVNEFFKTKIWPLVGAFLMSISPWLMHYSRTGFEATSMLFFILLGIYFWIKYVKNSQNKYLFLSLFTFTFSLYTYSTDKLHLIFIFLSLLVLWFKKIISLPKKTKIISISIILLVAFPMIFDTLKGNAGYRFSYINIFTDPTVSQTVGTYRLEDSNLIYGQQIGVKTALISKIFYNKVTQWANMFFRNYFSSFSTEFLFLNGDTNLRQGFQTNGYLLYPDLFFIIIGLITAFRSKKDNHYSKLFLFFILTLILIPIPFSLTRDSSSAHGTRLILMLPFLIFFSTLGISQIASKSKFLLPSILIIYLIFFADFYHKYFYHYPNISARSWHYGMKNVVIAADNDKDKYSRIYLSNSFEPFMPFFLNYTEYQPNNNFKCAPAISLKWDNTNYYNVMHGNGNKFYIGHFEWSPLIESKPATDNLFVITEEDLIQIRTAIDNYNRSNNKHISFSIIKKFDKTYIEQEIFYFISFNYEK